MQIISVDHAAQMLGVSSATIRNWANAGHIQPVSARPLSFSTESVAELKGKIGSVTFDKLQTRANKTASAGVFVPVELVGSEAGTLHIPKVTELARQYSLHTSIVVFLAALRLLESRGELGRAKNAAVFQLTHGVTWARESTRLLINQWAAELPAPEGAELGYALAYDNLVPQETDDFLAILYQSLAREGTKSEQGSYYTPGDLVNDALGAMTAPIASFLDPCCGAGKYLTMAAKHFNLEPEGVWGFDRDPIAVNIARVNLLLAFPEREFTPKIFCVDSLTELASGEMFCATNLLVGRIDAIATNPPWGAYKKLAGSTNSSKITSGETFSLFLEKSIRLLRPGGQLSFLLPESVLKIKTHADIRRLILAETQIRAISLLGRRFTGVFTPVVRLDVVKGAPLDDSVVTIENNGLSSQVSQGRFQRNANAAFDVGTAADEEQLLEKIFAVPHQTLAGNAQWALGIVTGDNKKHLLDSMVDGSEPVIRGSDVRPFAIATPHSFLKFQSKSFQQVAPIRFFRAPRKLIYKFISKSLVFAYDADQRLTLNSANILIPAIPGTTMKVALAFLNSAVFQYLFQKMFATHKVLRGDLERLPFPKLDAHTSEEIEGLVDLALQGVEVSQLIDKVIFRSFDLTDDELTIVNSAVGR